MTTEDDSDARADRGLDHPPIDEIIKTPAINGDDPMAFAEVEAEDVRDVAPARQEPVAWRAVVASLCGALAYAVGVVEASPDMSTPTTDLRAALDVGLAALGTP